MGPNQFIPTEITTTKLLPPRQELELGTAQRDNIVQEAADVTVIPLIRPQSVTHEVSEAEFTTLQVLVEARLRQRSILNSTRR